jgi:hypothetical protein
MQNNLLHRVYLAGYSGMYLSRNVRRLIARTRLHHAWLAGFCGSYCIGDIKYGVTDREWFRFRK